MYFGSLSFPNCTRLTSVTIYCSNIPDETFYGCMSLTSVTFGRPPIIGNNAFPEGTSGIGGNALRTAVYAESISLRTGTYTRTVNGSTWTKQ